MRLALVLAALLASVTAHSSTIYVDYATGSDANAGTQVSPKKNIPASLSAGDVVYLKRGVTYGASYTFANSGTVRATGSNGAVAANGTTFTSAGATFVTSGVTTSDLIFLAGEGLFGISSIDGETQLTLSSATQHRSLTSVGYAIALPITVTIDPAWGSGSATVTGQFVASNRDAIRINGSVTNGIEIIPGAARGVYCSSSSPAKRALWLQNLNIHDTSGDYGAIYLRYQNYSLVQGCYIHDLGNHDAVTGEDGITAISQADYLTIDNCEIYNTGDDGIQLAPADNSYIQRCNIHGCWSSGSHADGLAFNSSASFSCTIRYNSIYDNASNSDVEAVQFNLYCNIIYDTNQSDGRGNTGWRYKRGAGGVIRNNIFAYNYYWAISGANDGGAATIENNIFWENSTYNSNTEWYAPAGTTARNNIYRRTDYPQADDKLITIGASGTLTLAEAQALGYESGSSYYEDATSFWVSEARAALNMNPLNASVPQVSAGVSIPLSFDRVWNPFQTPPTIGAYEYPTDITAQPGELVMQDATLSVNESGGTLTVTILRTDGSDGAVSCTIATASGTADDGVDYASHSSTLNWADDDLAAKTITLTINQDGSDESNETFTVTISAPGGGASIGSPSATTVTIVDDDDTIPYVDLLAGTKATNLLVLSPFAITSGTVYQTSQTTDPSQGGGLYGRFAVVTNGNYYLSLLVDAANTARDSFFVEIDSQPTDPNDIADIIPTTSGFETRSVNHRGGGTFDAPEFQPQLWSLTGGVTNTLYIRGREANCKLDTITLVPEPSTPTQYLTVASTLYAPRENVGTISVQVNRTGDTTGTVTVNYATANVTAVAGTDYTATSGVLTFTDGVTTQNVTVTLLDNALINVDRSFTVTLSGATGATLTQSTSTIHILDDEQAPESYKMILRKGTIRKMN